MREAFHDQYLLCKRNFSQNCIETKMSVALERNNSGGDHRIERPGFVNHDMAYVSSIYNPLEFTATDRRAGKEDRSGSLSSSSTSSIGKNSDESVGGGDEGEEEAESEYKAGPLESLDVLEEVLPVKKSISIFYSGKSKSFTSLSDAASCSSIEDIRKPENAYTRKRKNLLAFNNFWDKNRGNIARGGIHGISKRPSNFKSMLSLVAATNYCESETSNSISSSPGCSLPPLPPHARIALQNERPPSPPAEQFPSWRAFSMSDLQSAAAAATTSNTGLLIYRSNV